MPDALPTMSRHLCAAFAILSLIAAAAVGRPVQASAPAEYPLSSAFKACVMRSGGVTAVLKNCLAAEHRLRDRELNRTYKSVMKQLRTQALRIRLRDSQRVWLRQRDQICQLAVDKSGMDGGTGGALVFDDCQVQRLGERILWLRKVPANPGYLTKV